MSKIILFAHGFGVQKDDRGLFTDIAGALESQYTTEMVDLNEVDLAKNPLTVLPLSRQAELFTSHFQKLLSEYPDAEFTIIAHSQGCIVAALARQHATKVILLAPPLSLEAERLIDSFSDRPGTVINVDGQSKLARRDGSRTIVGADYWIELQTINPRQQYDQLIAHNNTVIVYAEDDEVLGPDNNEDIQGARIIRLNANHDFTDDARVQLLELLQKELS